MSYHFNFTYVWRHFDRLAWGLLLSLELALASILIGMVIGLGLALAYTGGGRVVRAAVAAYVEFIRNVPLLLLVYLVFYGIPSVGGFAYDATTSFVLTLSVYAGAYLVEVFRAGLDAVPRGLLDAGKAVGLTPWQRLVHVRLPTMFRVVLPSLSNAYISLFKDTSLASVIAVPELTYGAQWIKTNSFRVIEVWAVVTP
ncbi:MAG TPA: amino acid ABC transporter permease, partial [Methylomirabilota bacterium]|nr:amino acid ABC transporter permease [Methylomirabilota bacterium]